MNWRYFTDGVDKFNDLISEMKNATDYIHMQYYIIRNDELFDEIRKVLIEKRGREWRSEFSTTLWAAACSRQAFKGA